ncbi:MAG: hypothetical protein ACK5JT_11735 [Hyphomicrobiaceae bacterium]
MFLIRSAFWLTLIVALLPSDPKEQARFFETASYAVNRAATFCDRNRTICDEGAEYWDVFKAKLFVGATMVRGLINERLAQRHRQESQQVHTGQGAQAPLFERDAHPTDTLMPRDAAPRWVRPIGLKPGS